MGSLRISTLAPMGGAKLWGFLEQARTVRLATAVDGGGAIVVSPAWFVVKDETVYAALDPQVGDPVATATPHADHLAHLAAGARLSAVIDEGDGVNDTRAARFAGRGELVDDPELVEELLDLVAAKYFHVGHPHLEHYFSAGLVADRRWCRLVPDELEGWDLRELPQPPIADMLPFPAHLNR
jgi:hypothetical protein